VLSGQEDAAGMMRYWYERAVDDQKAEIRRYKKKMKAQHPPVEPVPLTIEEDLSQDQGEEARPIEA